MTEAQITAELLAVLRDKLRGVILKHNDDSTIGLPDISVTSGGVTQWVEVKLVKFKKAREFDLSKIVEFGKPQSRLCGKLDLHGRCFYVIFFTDGDNWWTFMDSAVAVANRCCGQDKLSLVPMPAKKDFDGILGALKLNMEEDRL